MSSTGKRKPESRRGRSSRPAKGPLAAKRSPRADGSAAEPGPIRVNLVSLGCPKNLVDSEMILGDAGAAGLAVAARPEDADVIVVNTCSFIDSAKEESINAILEACEVKRASDRAPRVVVTGCLAQRYGEDLRREVPEVDAIVGLGQYEGIGGLLRQLATDRAAERASASSGGAEGPLLRVDDPNRACTAEVGRFRLTPSHFAYLKISDGCDNPCTFCSIPSFRGRFRSKPLEMIEAEARELAAAGAKEIIIISQDTTSYGIDLYGTFELPRLLERVAAVEGVEWVRVLYVYPTAFSDAMIDAVARLPQVVKYIDIPIQHIGDRMLRRMGRRMDEAGTRRLLDRMRERIPGLYLRTTFIVGFPGEGSEDFRTLLDFVREFRFERLGVFPYSREEGTPAFKLREEVSEETARRRIEELMLAQQEVAFAHNRRRAGERCRVLIDDRRGGRYLARSHGEAPEIDPSILVSAGDEIERQDGGPAAGSRRSKIRSGALVAAEADSGGIRELSVLRREPAAGAAPAPRLQVGRFAHVQITGAKGYDLLARAVPGPVAGAEDEAPEPECPHPGSPRR